AFLPRLPRGRARARCDRDGHGSRGGIPARLWLGAAARLRRAAARGQPLAVRGRRPQALSRHAGGRGARSGDGDRIVDGGEGRPPDMLRGGVLIPIEDGQWMVTVGGASGEYPPTDEGGFMAALANLRSPLIAEAVALAQPISPIYGTRTMSNRYRHYERWGRSVGGFIAVGDAVCAFNPIYGQGMTTAALCATALQAALQRTPGGALPATFFAR